MPILPFTSIWEATTEEPVANPWDALAKSEHCDVAIIGGGILGLSTALHAARRGLSVRVLEATEIGEAASGLNGGQVIPGFKHDPDELVARFGEERGENLVRFGAGLADAVFDLIARERLSVPCHRSGWIQAAPTPAAAQRAARRARQWIDRGVPARILSADETALMTGAQGYVGGWLDPRAGVINPLAYVRELARIAHGEGVRIAVRTRAVRLARRDGRWVVGTNRGHELRADHVLAATNAYADGLIPGLARSFIPLQSFQVATGKLPPARAARILPGGQAVSDLRRVLFYFRKDQEDRLVLGGRGPVRKPRGPEAWTHIERAVTRLFPALSGVAIEHRWYGQVALTLDNLPHVNEPETGLIAVVGCQGRGVGLMTALGPCLAEYFATGDHTSIPIPVTPIQPIALHRFRSVGVGAAIAWNRALDALGR